MSLALFSSASTSRIVFTGRTTRNVLENDQEVAHFDVSLGQGLVALTSLRAGVRDAEGAIAAE
eukprot:2540923-Prymnesium_polylepis.1